MVRHSQLAHHHTSEKVATTLQGPCLKRSWTKKAMNVKYWGFKKSLTIIQGLHCLRPKDSSRACGCAVIVLNERSFILISVLKRVCMTNISAYDSSNQWWPECVKLKCTNMSRVWNWARAGTAQRHFVGAQSLVMETERQLCTPRPLTWSSCSSLPVCSVCVPGRSLCGVTHNSDLASAHIR